MAAHQDVIPGMESLTVKPMTPARLLEIAVERGDIEMMARAMELQINWEKYEAKRAFDSALEAFRKNKTVVKKTKEVVIATSGGGEMRYSHAELEKCDEIISDALAAVGLTYTWKPVASTDGKPQMALVLRGFGHTEEMGALVGPPDLSGGKNAMQAVGSSTKYLARYVLFYSLGIVPQDRDDDGRAATGGMTEQAIEDYCIKISDSSTVKECMDAFGEAWKVAGGANDKPARDRIRKVYEEKKKHFAAVKHEQR
jgi:hypothetical protein